MLLICLAIVFTGCNKSWVKQIKNIEYKDINLYLELDVVYESGKDIVWFNDEISLKIVFKNKTDSSFYFRPDALVILNRELYGFYESDINSIFLNQYLDLDNLILIEAHGIYSKTYKATIEKPWCKPGKNELYVMYIMRARKEPKHRYEVLYGRLVSPAFEIFVKGF